MNIKERLRKWVEDIRRKPEPLSVAIPMVIEAANEIENLERHLYELIERNQAGFDRVFEEMQDDPNDPYDRKWSTICLYIASMRDDALRYRFICEGGRNRKPYVAKFKGSSDFGEYEVWYNHFKAEIDEMVDEEMKKGVEYD